MAKETDLVKTMLEILRTAFESAEEVAVALTEMLKRLNESNDLKKMMKYAHLEGGVALKEVDPKVYDTLTKELDDMGIFYTAGTGKNEETGREATLIMIPKSLEPMFEQAKYKALIKTGLLSEIDKDDFAENFKNDEINVVKNLDINIAYRVSDYARDSGLTVSIEKNNDATCDLYSLKEHSDNLAMAIVFAEYELHSDIGKYIYEKNAFTNTQEKFINDNINKETDFYIISKDGYPIIHINDEKCSFSYKGEDGEIHTDTELRVKNKDKEFKQYVGAKLAKMDNYVTMTLEEYQINKNTNGKVMQEKINEMPKEPDKYQQIQKDFLKIKEKYEKENTLKDNKEADLKARAENFYTFIQEEIKNIPDFPILTEPNMLTEIAIDIDNIKNEIQLGKYLNLDSRIKDLEDEKDPELDNEVEKFEERENKRTTSREEKKKDKKDRDKDRERADEDIR